MKASVKVTAILQNPAGVIEDVVPIEMPDISYGKSAVLRILTTYKAVGFIREISPTHMHWISADSPRILNVEFELQTVALADNIDMAKATKGLIQP